MGKESEAPPGRGSESRSSLYRSHLGINFLMRNPIPQGDLITLRRQTIDGNGKKKSSGKENNITGANGVHKQKSDKTRKIILRSTNDTIIANGDNTSLMNDYNTRKPAEQKDNPSDKIVRDHQILERKGIEHKQVTEDITTIKNGVKEDSITQAYPQITSTETIDVSENKKQRKDSISENNQQPPDKPIEEIGIVPEGIPKSNNGMVIEERKEESDNIIKTPKSDFPIQIENIFQDEVYVLYTLIFLLANCVASTFIACLVENKGVAITFFLCSALFGIALIGTLVGMTVYALQDYFQEESQSQQLEQVEVIKPISSVKH